MVRPCVPLFDVVANEHFVERVLPEDEETFTRIQVRAFNLRVCACVCACACVCV